MSLPQVASSSHSDPGALVGSASSPASYELIWPPGQPQGLSLHHCVVLISKLLQPGGATARINKRFTINSPAYAFILASPTPESLPMSRKAETLTLTDEERRHLAQIEERGSGWPWRSPELTHFCSPKRLLLTKFKNA